MDMTFDGGKAREKTRRSKLDQLDNARGSDRLEVLKSWDQSPETPNRKVAGSYRT